MKNLPTICVIVLILSIASILRFNSLADQGLIHADESAMYVRGNDILRVVLSN